MGSINKSIAKDIIKGKYPEDNCTKIVTYNNMFDGGLTFAVVCKREYQNRYEESGACDNVQTVWTSDGGTTSYGFEVTRGD